VHLEHIAPTPQQTAQRIEPAVRGDAEQAATQARVGIVDEMEHGDTAGREHAEEFLDVACRQHGRNVLQGDVREDQVDAGIGDVLDARRRVLAKFRLCEVGVQLARSRDHARRDVDTDHALEVRGQRARQTSDAAPEVERDLALPRPALRSERAELRLDLDASGREEFFRLPAAAAFVRLRQHGPQRIVATERLPDAAQAIEIAHARDPRCGVRYVPETKSAGTPARQNVKSTSTSHPAAACTQR
jgi:hypothetical protein